MLKICNKIIHFFDDLYGQEENVDISQVIAGIVMSIITGVVLVYMIYGLKGATKIYIEKIAGIVYIFLFFSLGLFMVSSYFFRKRVKNDKMKKLKYLFLIFSLILLMFPLIPLATPIVMLKKINFMNLFRHSLLYGGSIFLLFIFNFVLFAIIPCLKLNEKVPFLRLMSVALLVIFILDIMLIHLFGYIYFNLKIKRNIKRNYSSELIENLKYDYKDYKDEIYLLIYVFITSATISSYLLNFNYIMNLKIVGSYFKELYCSDKSFSDSLLYVLGIYTAWDTLRTKWIEVKFTNKENKNMQENFNIDKNEIINKLEENIFTELKQDIVTKLKEEINDDMKKKNKEKLIQINNGIEKISQLVITDNNEITKQLNSLCDEIKNVDIIGYCEYIKSTYNSILDKVGVCELLSKQIVNINSNVSLKDNHKSISDYENMNRINEFCKILLKIEKDIRYICFNAKIEAYKSDNNAFNLIAVQLMKHLDKMEKNLIEVHQIIKLSLNE